jgi:hypothetical protein
LISDKINRIAYSAALQYTCTPVFPISGAILSLNRQHHTAPFSHVPTSWYNRANDFRGGGARRAVFIFVHFEAQHRRF